MKYLIFATVLCTALYFGKPQEPTLKKPFTPCGKPVIKTGFLFDTPIDSVEYIKHRNHFGCVGLICPILKN